ncbi:MAG TPA: SurA N-terminal domain-containing protein [Hyphomicrobiaceae bacterium]|nr:SurA N-terminal domain-containing protein [Hyphomicrobiaceae bacterium]
MAVASNVGLISSHKTAIWLIEICYTRSGVAGNPMLCGLSGRPERNRSPWETVRFIMLDAIRRNASGWLAKLLIGILVLSFAVWGVADMVTGVGRTTVAKVGSTEISTNVFQRAYQAQIDAFAQRYRRRLTPEQAKVFGVEGQVVNRLVGAAAVDNHAEQLSLDLAQNAVIRAVADDPVFKGIDGKFSQSRFDDLLRQAGYNQTSFLAERRRDELRGQITDAMLSGIAPPKTLLSIMNTFENETRIAKYFSINAKTAVKLPEPAGNALKETYDKSKQDFMTPEFRKFNVLMLTATDAIKQIVIPDDELKAGFERIKTTFATPERRHILQISFKDEAAAKKARDEIIGGKSFEDAAKATGAKPTDIDLGTLSRDKLFDKAIAEAAFKLEKGKVSDVVKGRFASVLLLAKEVYPGKQPTFEEVKDQVRYRLSKQRAADQIRKLHDQVDDNRLAGKSLKEISELLKLTFHAVDAMDKSGNGQDGKPVFKSVDLGKVAGAIFSGEVGVENEVLELSGGGYAWSSLIAVTPQKQKEFEDVRDDVQKLWTAQETAKSLGKQAAELVKRINSGENFEAAAKSASGEVKTTPAFKRNDKLPDLSPTAVAQAFALTKGTAGSTGGTDGSTRIIFVVTEIKPPEAAKPEDEKQARESLAEALRDDTVVAYINALRDKQGVTINQAVIDRTIGAVPRTQ